MPFKIYFALSILGFLLLFQAPIDGLLDLESLTQDFVLETKKIEIPGYPYAFNPSIIRWKGKLLLSFRNIPEPKTPFISNLGLVWLNEQFEPISQPQILNTREPGHLVPSRAEDARLILIGEQLYIVYSDNSEPKISKKGFRVYLAEVHFKEKQFFLKNIESLAHFEGASPQKREKNWTPFNYKENLLLAYSLQPHLIFRPLLRQGRCETFTSSLGKIDWKWGDLRGGTPGLIDDTYYLAFFHTCQPMETVQSNGKNILHYFMGVYTFALEPPFEILSISSEPIFAKGFYQGTTYKPYWHPINAVFPCGFVFDQHFIWIVYGRQDHEAWVMKLDKQKLLQSLRPVSTIYR